MSFSAIKDITISNERTVYNRQLTSADSLLDMYSNEPMGAMHKLSTVYYTTEADTSVYDDSKKDKSAETNAKKEKGYIEPYNVTTSDSGEFVITHKDSGYLKYSPNASIEGTANITYFWVEDFKNWCTWAINGNSLYVDKPATNAYGLCVWNGKSGWELIGLDGAVHSSDENFNLWQNTILAKLRTTNVNSGSVIVDEYIRQYRGDFKDFGDMPFGDRVPGMISCVYPLRESIKYSINDPDTFQTIRYGNPMNMDLACAANESTYIRKIKNLYLDTGAVKRYWDDDLDSAEKRIWDACHYDENSDTGGEETSDVVATVLATAFLGPVVGFFTWRKVSENGNSNLMYHYKRGKHEDRGPYDDKIFYDPNYGDTISWSQIAPRYFSSFFEYGVPLQPYIRRTDKMQTSDSIVFEFKSKSYAGKFMEIFYRNGHLKWQCVDSGHNNTWYSIGQTGETSLKFGYMASVDYMKTESEWQNRFTSTDVYTKRLGCLQHVTNLDFPNLASFGVPCLFRLPTGELGLNVQMRMGGPRGVSGFDVEFLNKKCQTIFGTGQDKTINDHWMKAPIINSYEEAATSIKKLSDSSLDSTKDSQNSVIVNNEINIGFSANNVVLSTSDVESNDYVAKW